MTAFRAAVGFALLLCAVPALGAHAAEHDRVTGLPIAPGFDEVRLHCTGCHSGRLVAQNRADRDGWIALIRWMQRTQRLPSLGEDESVVLDYLATNLGPATDRRRRRAPLAPSLRPPE